MTSEPELLIQASILLKAERATPELVGEALELCSELLKVGSPLCLKVAMELQDMFFEANQ